MRSPSDEVLYVGKAKNLRKRLGSYRVANPDRMSRRHLRLVNAVHRIELFECETESSALAKESALLRNLKPRFNRAGTWTALSKYLAWQFKDQRLTFVIAASVPPDWTSLGAMGSWAIFIRNALLRRVWCGLFPERGLCGMPPGWVQGKCGSTVTLALPTQIAERENLCRALSAFVHRDLEPLSAWIKKRTPEEYHPFEVLACVEDLEVLAEFCNSSHRTSACKGSFLLPSRPIPSSRHEVAAGENPRQI